MVDILVAVEKRWKFEALLYRRVARGRRGDREMESGRVVGGRCGE